MIKKNVDSILIGQNYISFLIAFDLLRKNCDVLILDDDRIKQSAHYYSYFSSLEKSFIQTWAQDSEVPMLSNIDEYAKISPILIQFDSLQIFIGRENPYLNLMELARKIPNLFEEIFLKLKQSNISMEEFNNDYFMFCSRTGKTLCLFKGLQNLSTFTFSHHAPDYLNDIFSLFEAKINKQEQGEAENLFIYGLRSIYHNILDSKLANLESIHLFISLLGPRYHFTSADLYKNLIEEFVKRGGFFRAKKIREWKFYKNRPWCVELDSFEGIVHPKYISFVGGKPSKFPLRFAAQNLYLTYEVEIKAKFNIEVPLDSYYFDSSKIGSNIPYISKRNENGKTLLTIFTVMLSCQKAQFHKEEITAAIKALGLIETDQDILGIVEGDDILSLKGKSSIHFPQKVAIYDTSLFFMEKELKGVHYIGPLQKAPLGLLSSLMESKDHRNFMSL